jgi:hypothetical protein
MTDVRGRMCSGSSMGRRAATSSHGTRVAGFGRPSDPLGSDAPASVLA